jgi:hypothetical protein
MALLRAQPRLFWPLTAQRARRLILRRVPQCCPLRGQRPGHVGSPPRAPPAVCGKPARGRSGARHAVELGRGDCFSEAGELAAVFPSGGVAASSPAPRLSSKCALGSPGCSHDPSPASGGPCVRPCDGRLAQLRIESRLGRRRRGRRRRSPRHRRCWRHGAHFRVPDCARIHASHAPAGRFRLAPGQPPCHALHGECGEPAAAVDGYASVSGGADGVVRRSATRAL